MESGTDSPQAAAESKEPQSAFQVPVYFKATAEVKSDTEQGEVHCVSTSSKDQDDWMFDRLRFMELDDQFGPFTLDAAASANGDDAQCKNFCSVK